MDYVKTTIEIPQTPKQAWEKPVMSQSDLADTAATVGLGGDLSLLAS